MTEKNKWFSNRLAKFVSIRGGIILADYTWCRIRFEEQYAKYKTHNYHYRIYS
jgi:hypothetical protein